MFRKIAIAAVLAAPVFGLAVPATAASDFYAGITIGYGFGGTYGKYSRLLAEELQRHIPGAPNIIVKSMPGAGGMKATNYAHNAMPSDGLHLLMRTDTTVVAQLSRPKKMKFDMRKFTWLGSSNVTNMIIVVRSDTGARALANLKTKPVILGAVGKTSNSYLTPKLLKEVMGWKMKPISGYKGSANEFIFFTNFW